MKGFQEFCGGEFWNATLLKDNTWPQFTECFMHTALIWVPCGFLWLFLPVYISAVHESASNVPHRVTWVSVTRLLSCVTLALLALTMLILRASSKTSNRSAAAFLGDGVCFVTYVILAVLTEYERSKGVQQPGVAFCFWLISSLCTVIPFYTMIIQQRYQGELLDFIVLTLSFLLKLAALVLTGFTLTPADSKYEPMHPKPCPITTCSFPSFLTHWWMTSVIIKNYRSNLEEKDLWTLPPRDQTTVQLSRFEKKWKDEKRRCALLNSKRQAGAAHAWKPVELTSVEPGRNGVVSAMQTATEKSSLIINHTGSPAYSSTATDKSSLLDNASEYSSNKSKDERNKDSHFPSLMRVVVKLHGMEFLISFIQRIISDILLLLNPLLLGYLMGFVAERTPGRVWQGYVICFAMLTVIVVRSVFQGHSMFRSNGIGLRMKSSFIAAVYKKALTISNSARSSTTVGEIVNLMSVDAQKIQDVMEILVVTIATPLQVAEILGLLYFTLGPSVLAGILLLVCLVPLNVYVFDKQRELQGHNLKFKDIRIRLYSEILSGIKILKLYGWEPAFRQRIRQARVKELAILFKLAILKMIACVIWDISPYLVSVATFATYAWSDSSHYLDAGKIFVGLTLFNLLRVPLLLLSNMLSCITHAHVSMKRIHTFLTMDELDPEAARRSDSAAKKPLTIKNGTFSWDKSLSPSLTNIDLEVDDGRLIAVVGPVGCGKSSLINAMLGEMEVLTGRVTTRGRIAYVPQQAWIQNSTLRDNVLFGKPYDQSKYRLALESCQLERDLSIFPAADLTEIGEKGINLSGGQKQRVSLARAVYSESDVYLLDDPLSAVDSHVGKAIFKKVVGPTGLLRGKTRILVTHGVHWLPMVDEIIVMHDGKISERGSYEALLSHNGPFAQFLKTFLTEAVYDSDDDNDDDHPEFREIVVRMRERVESITSDTASSADELHDNNNRRNSGKRTRTDKKKNERKIDGTASDETAASYVQTKENAEKDDASGMLTTVEATEKGTVKMAVFSEYAKAAGLLPMSFGYFCLVAFQAFSIGANFWLKQWAGDSGLLNASLTSDVETLQTSNDYYLAIYGAFGVLQAILVVACSYVFWVRSVEASKDLHARFADRILHAPMSFFDTTPIGRILNRASRDVDTIDNSLPPILRDFANTSAVVVLSLLVIVIQTPMSVLIVLPVLVCTLFAMTLYIPTARQVKRLEAVTRSPVYTLFSETLSGAASIRAYDVSERFVEECMRRVDQNQVFYLAFSAANRWLQWSSDILSALVVFASAVFTVVSPDKDAGDAGLSTSYAFQISTVLFWAAKIFCDFETSIVSVERLKEYSLINTEAEWVLPDKRPSPSWPENGEIILDNYQTRYRPGLDLVLKGVTCTIKPGEKVGVVGRTGAGKSSLTLALFRLIEAAGGAIWIDNINIADIGLHDLRHKLTILPQDPVLFSGTLRMNLDPFDEYVDEQLWTALERAHLKHAVSQMSGGLQYEVGEEGANLSVGQRQLVCLARTLLRRTKILVLDEATAAVDMETDSLIQNTIRSAFSTCTVITIAHRLNTIMDYDRIMVMDAGEVKEFAAPSGLLADRKSLFHKMAKDAGLV